VFSDNLQLVFAESVV